MFNDEVMFHNTKLNFQQHEESFEQQYIMPPRPPPIRALRTTFIRVLPNFFFFHAAQLIGTNVSRVKLSSADPL